MSVDSQGEMIGEMCTGLARWCGVPFLGLPLFQQPGLLPRRIERLMVANVIAALSLAVSASSLLVALAAFRVQRRRTNMELARSLHSDLTSGEVARARDTLGTIVYDREVMAPGDIAPRKARFVEVRTDYFTLLWCFERIWAGRETITADDRAGASGVACRYLDQIIRWHVLSWAKDLPLVRHVLKLELSSALEDEESWAAFGNLCNALLTAEQRSEIQSALKSQRPPGWSPEAADR
jgi:hypothetical protein